MFPLHHLPQFISLRVGFVPCFDLSLQFVVWKNDKKPLVHSRFCHGARYWAIVDWKHLMFDFTSKDCRHRLLPMLPEEDMGGCGQFFVEAGACNTTRVGFPLDKVYIFGFFGLDKTLLRIFLEFGWLCLGGLQSLLAPSGNEWRSAWSTFVTLWLPSFRTPASRLA